MGKLVSRSVNPKQQVWGIVQGSTFKSLRRQSAEQIRELGFSGYAIGGVAVGEPPEKMYQAVIDSNPYLEEEKPKHLLGVGTPEQIVKAVGLGMDSFDCVIPTREARHGKFYVNLKPGQGKGYLTFNILNSRFKEDFTPVDNTCNCYACLNYTKAYIRHLFLSKEPLSIRLATMHNLRFYLNMMQRIRESIDSNAFSKTFKDFRDKTPKEKKA
jgi:queuine tRNA-ribosyltransferase